MNKVVLTGFAAALAFTLGQAARAADDPKVIVDKLNAEVNAILRLPEIQERLTALGMDPDASTPEQFATLIKADSERWSKVIRAAKIHLD